MANQAATQQEPTMEEILASIRRIISEDSSEPAKPAATPVSAKAPPPPPVQEDVLELNEIVAEEEFEELPPEPAPIPTRQPEPPPVQAAQPQPQHHQRPFEVVQEREREPVVPPTPTPPRPQPAYTKPVQQESDVMLVEKEEEPGLVSSNASSKAIAAFSQLARSMPVVKNEGRTLEDVVQDMLKPMLKEWLDEHLPGTVERLVQEEIDRLARQQQRR
jgi:cell pole-organizing protein PopZ